MPTAMLHCAQLPLSTMPDHEYNHLRPYAERHRRLRQLEAKKVPYESEKAKFIVVPTREGFCGKLDLFSAEQWVCFENLQTARSYAMHYSDMYDHVAGVFRKPEFLGGYDVR